MASEPQQNPDPAERMAKLVRAVLNLSSDPQALAIAEAVETKLHSSLPRRRREPQAQLVPAASFADGADGGQEASGTLRPDDNHNPAHPTPASDALPPAPDRFTLHLDPTVADCESAIARSEFHTDDQFTMLRRTMPSLPGNRLLDFGCGVKPDHRSNILDMGYGWNGLEVAGSMDPGTGPQLGRLAEDPSITLYGGGAIPFPDASFDAVFSNQSLEHGGDFDLSIREIARVLKPSGCLIGSVSHLEP